MSVKVYGSPRCPKCASVKQYLESKGISFTYHDVSTDNDAKEELRRLGIMALPVIQKGDKVVIGFDAVGIEEVIVNDD